MTPADVQAELRKLPLHQKIQAIFEGTCALNQFAETAVLPVLTSLISMNSHEQAISASYYRIAAWMKSLTRLTSSLDIQATCSAARTLFELTLDIKELAEDAALSERYHDFTFFQRFKAARALVSHCDGEGVPPANCKLERAFTAEAANIARFEALKTKYSWQNPKQWSHNDLWKRADAAGPKYAYFYKSAQPRLSWYMHAGAVGMGGMSRTGIESGYGWSHSLSQDLFVDATERLCSALPLFVADTTLKPKLNEAKQAHGKSLIQAYQDTLGSEPEAD